MIDPKFRGQESKPCSECGRAYFRDKRCTYAHWGRSRFCSRDCSAAYGARNSRLNNTLAEQFERFVIRQDGCWGWRGALNTKKGGYAMLSWSGSSYYGHLVSLELDGRKVPKGMYGCHHCDSSRFFVVQSNRQKWRYTGLPRISLPLNMRRLVVL